MSTLTTPNPRLMWPWKALISMEFCLPLTAAILLASSPARAHIGPSEKLHPAAEAYRRAMFVLNLNPVAWDQVWPDMATNGRTFPLWFLIVLTCLTGILSLHPASASQFESPKLTPKGEFLLELHTIVEREENSTERVTTYLFPQPRLYIGLLSNFELQLESDGVVVTDPDGAPSDTAGSDFVVKGKIGLTQGSGAIPQSALFAVISFPTGGSAVTSDGVDPSVSYLATWGLPHNMAFTLNAGIGAPTNGSGESNRYFEFASVFTLEFPIIGALGGFVEYFNSIGNENQPDQHSMDAGLSYQLAENLALEFTGGVGLVEAAPDYFFSTQLGISF